MKDLKLVYDPKIETRYDHLTGIPTTKTEHFINNSKGDFIGLVSSYAHDSERIANQIVKATNDYYKLLECIEELKSECFAWKSSSIKGEVDMRNTTPQNQEEYDNYKQAIQDNIDFIMKGKSNDKQNNSKNT